MKNFKNTLDINKPLDDNNNMKTINNKMQTVFTGQKRYTDKKVNELKKRGYKIVRKFQFGDKSTTYVMEKE